MKRSDIFSRRSAFASRTLALISLVLPALVQAGSTTPTTAVATDSPEKTKPSFITPVNDFVHDSILRPTQPFELVPGKDPNAWAWSLEPYLWLTAINGSVGVGGEPPSAVKASAKSLLQNLNWGVMAKGEVRKGRWGVLADGYYASLTASGSLDSKLYESGTIDFQQAFASLALAYRIIDDRRGFLDVYAGARYNYLGTQIETNVNSAGINAISDDITNQISAGINSAITQALASGRTLSPDDLAKLAGGRFSGKKLEKIAQIPKSLRDRISPGRLNQILSSKNSAFREYLAARAAVAAAEAKGSVSSALQARAAKARKNFSKELAKEIEDSLSTYDSGDQWWIDPIVGFRAQVNITRWLYLAAQGDVGGFGVGSQIAWNTQATIGVNITRNVFAEIGYRYMYVDYNKNGVLYEMNTYGLFAGGGVRF